MNVNAGNDLLPTTPKPGPDMPKAWFSDPFSILDSMGLGYRAAPSALSYETLRQMAASNTVLGGIHNTRVTQVSNFVQIPPNRYSIGYKVRHKDPRRKLTRSEEDYARSVEDFLLKCGDDKNTTRDDFVTFVKKIVRDRLRYDQVNFEIVRKRSGKPHSFYAVDAATFRLKVNRRRGGPQKLEHVGRKPRYVQVINGAVINDFTEEELAWGVNNPRTDLVVAGYGYSEEEQLITTVTSHLWAEEWNRKMFSQGATTKGILNLRGNIPPQQLEAFKRQWITQVSGVTNAWRTPILNSEGIEWVSLQPTNAEMGYQGWMEYLIKIACAIYLIDPSEINFDTRSGVGSQPMFMTTNEAQQKVSKDRGLQPLLRYVSSLINKHIVSRMDDQWVFEFVGIDAKTEEQAIELRLKELGSYKTLNEVRREVDNLPPVEDGDVVLNPVYTGYKSQKAMQKQQADAMAAQGGGSAPGAPPQESLFGNGGAATRGAPIPFEREEQAAGRAIEGKVQDGEAKRLMGRSGVARTDNPEWEETRRSTKVDLKKGVAYLSVEE
jgi:hypothetical protein